MAKGKKYKGIHITGVDALSAKLKENATMKDVKTVVKMNGSELTSGMQRKSQDLLTGHWEGKRFVKPTGATKRSITLSIEDNGMSAHTGPKTEYAPYLVYGTRFMSKRDFVSPPFRKQSAKFKKDLERLFE